MNPPSESGSAGQRRFLSAGLVLLLCFGVPVYQLVRFALHSEMYSYVVLIPFISIYLVRLNHNRLAPAGAPLPRVLPATLLLAGLGFLTWYLLSVFSPEPPARQNALTLAMLSLTLLLAGFACLFLGRNVVRAHVFPLGFLAFMAPFPLFVEKSLQGFLQIWSAVIADGMFRIAGTPTFRDVTLFRLPGISLEVAPECSGIHSTIALFITSLVAGQVLLRTTWKRVVLALIVVPIALLRNGFRVFTIGELCVHVSPDMIDSWIHRHGGPFFFVLSLIPFSVILYFLQKFDRAVETRPKPLS